MIPQYILTADIHLRDTQPKCRTDNYFQAQTQKITYLRKRQEELKCIILDAGDLFHKHRSSPFLEAWAINNMPKNFNTIAGNHDLPYRNEEEYYNSSLYVLESSGIIGIISKHGWAAKNKGMLVRHEFVSLKGEIPDSISASDMLKKYPDYDLILTGHNHQQFSYTENGRLLVNAGSMMRSSADQIDFKPCLWLYDTVSNTAEKEYYPIEENVIDRKYLDDKKQIDEKINSFIETMDKGYDISLNFTDNVKKYLKENKCPEDVEEKIWAFVGENDE